MANTEMIDQLVSEEALKSLDTLNRKLATSYDEMEKLLQKVQLLSSELSSPAKSYIELAKSIDKVEKAVQAKQKVERDELKTLQEIQKVRDEVIHSAGEEVKAAERQEKAVKKLEQTTKQLLAASERTATGIDISAYIKENGDGMKSYSGAINAVSQQMGIIEGLQEALNEKFKEGAISEEEYNNAISRLSKRQTEYEGALSSLIEKYDEAGEAQRAVFDPASEAFAGLTPKIQQQAISLVEMNVELQNIREAQKELDKAYKDGTVSIEEYAEKKARLNTLEATQSKSVKDLSNELQLNRKVTDTLTGSYDNLSARYSLLKIQINALGEAEGKNAVQKRELEKEAKALYEEMNRLQKATGKAQLQVGDYTMVNKELESALNLVNPALGGTVSGIKAATKAAIAFTLTPVGVFLAAIAAGLAAVTSWFNRTEEGQSALMVGSAAFTKVLNVLLNVVDKVGEWIFKAFTSPKEAVKELGDMIEDNLINRMSAFGKQGEAIIKIFSKDWKQGFKDLGNAVVQLFTGIEDPLNKLSQGLDNTVEGIQRAARIQSGLNDLAVRKRDLGVEEAKTLAEMNRLRNIANDQEKTSSERLAANNKYIEIANKFGEENIAIAKESYELRKAQIEENKKGSALSREEKEELAKLEADMYKAEAQREGELFTATRTNNSLRKEGIKEINRELKALGELESFNYRKSADLQERIYKDATLSFDERRTALRAYIDDEIAIIETKEKEEIRQEGLTETQKKLIHEKALYEIYKTEQKYGEEIKNLNIKEAEEQVKKVQALISGKSEELNGAMQDDLVLAAKVYAEQIKLNINNEEERVKITEDYEKKRFEIIRSYNQQAFEAEVEQLQLLLENTSLSEEKKIEIYKKIDALRKKNAKDLADYEIYQTEDKVDKMLNAEEEFIKFMNNKRTQAVLSMWNVALDTANMYYDAELSKIDELEKREREYFDERIKMIDENLAAGLMSEEEADARKRILEETQLQREKEYEAQRKEIQRKQAIWQKANAIVQATINTAQAATMAYTAGPIIGPILAGIIAALGAAQIAMIAAQPIPSYAKGTDDHPGGWARLGDGGKPEMVILPTGEIWKTPATDTYAYLPPHTEVLPDYKKAMMDVASYPLIAYDDDRGETVLMHDEILRRNTGETNARLSSINKGINAIRANNAYTNKRVFSGYRVKTILTN